jgi:hypothetical protein
MVGVKATTTQSKGFGLKNRTTPRSGRTGRFHLDYILHCSTFGQVFAMSFRTRKSKFLKPCHGRAYFSRILGL